jgi:hypothetical protein
VGLEYYPNSLFQLWKLDDIKVEVDKKMEKNGIHDYEKAQTYPELALLLQELNEVDKKITEMGYSNLTPEQYRKKVMEIEKGKIALDH